MTNEQGRLILHHDTCHIIQPRVVKALGRSAALFLQQLHYWLTSSRDVGKVQDGHRWVFNSFKSWADHLQTLSEATVKRAVIKLRDLGLIETRNLNNHKAVHTNWYTIHYDKLQSFLKGLVGEGAQVKMIHPLDQNDPITPEITSDIFPSNKSDFLIEKKDLETTIHPIPKPEGSKKKERGTKATIAVDMLQIWNEMVGEGTQKAAMTKDRARFLVAAFKFKFESNLDQFKRYCQKVSRSDFLMGRVKASFKATIDWVLKFNTIQRVLEGQFGGGDEPMPVPDLDSATMVQNEQQIHEDIKAQHHAPTLEDIHLRLLKGLGSARYLSWKASIKDILTGEGTLTFLISTIFARDWMNTHMKTDMERALRKRIELVLG